jgi:hypothetical protein
MQRPPSVWVLVEATREISGPAQHAVVEMGSPLRGLPALVDRRRENQVTGVSARTERRSFETMDLNATGSRQTHRGQVTGSIGVEPRMIVRVASVLRGAHKPCRACAPEHENACVRPMYYYMYYYK